MGRENEGGQTDAGSGEDMNTLLNYPGAKWGMAAQMRMEGL